MNRLQISELLDAFQVVRLELKSLSALNYKTIAAKVDLQIQKIDAILRQMKRDLQ